MILVKTGSLEQKRDIMSKKYKFKGEKERLEDDLTERRLKMQRELKKRLWKTNGKEERLGLDMERFRQMIYGGNETKRRLCYRLGKEL